MIDYPGYAHRADVMYEALDNSEALQRDFLSDPARIASDFLLPRGTRISAASISHGNRLLFSLLSNPKFIAWSETFQARIQKQLAGATSADGQEASQGVRPLRLELSTIYKEIAEATLAFADRELIYSLMVSDPDIPQVEFLERSPVLDDDGDEGDGGDDGGPGPGEGGPGPGDGEPGPGEGGEGDGEGGGSPVFIYVFVAVAVLVVVVAPVWERRDALVADRVHLMHVSRELTSKLQKHAATVRQGGGLIPDDQILHRGEP